VKEIATLTQKCKQTFRAIVTLKTKRIDRFGAAGKEHGRLLYNDGALLLALAFAARALHGFNSLDDLWQQGIPSGENELPLRWNDEMLNMRVTSLSRDRFRRIFKSTLANAVYLCSSSIHQIRQHLGQQVDS
jgi:hypothetical protein